MHVSSLLSAFQFNWYGFLIGAAMLIGIVIASFMARSRGYSEDLVFIVAIICIPLAIVGARTYYVIFDILGGDKPKGYWTFRRIIGLEDGGLEGLAIYGGIIAAMLGSVIVWAIFKRKKAIDRVTFMQMFDLFFILIILGQAIGRWGNYFNEEAHGNLVTNPKWQWFPYAILKSGDGEWYQACFFYEFFFNTIGFGLMMWLYMGKRKSYDGFIFSFYCIWYGTVRMFLEGLRSDSLWLIPERIRVSQLLSGLLILLGIILILVHVVRALHSKKRIFIFVKPERLNGEYFGYETSKLSQPRRIYKKKGDIDVND